MTEKMKKLTACFVLSWIFGILFVFLGIGVMGMGSSIQGIIIILCSVMIIPYFNKIIGDKVGWEISGGIKFLLIIIIIIAYGFSLGGMTGEANNTSPNSANANSLPVSTETSSTDTTTPPATTTPAVEEKTDTATMGEKNALKQAQSYLRYSAFSYSGLIDQLEFGGFTYEEAKYGVDNSGADWNEQAASQAQSYLDYSAFSREGLIDQLEFGGFTKEQAEYGVQAVGY